MGGYVTRYKGNEKGSTFDYLTIRGAGHLVPEYKGKEALEMITRFIKNENWKGYVAPNVTDSYNRWSS